MTFTFIMTATLSFLLTILTVVTSCGQSVTVNPNVNNVAPQNVGQLFSSPDGKFSIRLPLRAETMPEFGEVKKTSIGENRVFEWSSPNGAVLVQITTDLTEILVSNQEAVLAHALEFGIKSSNGKLISDEPITLGTIRGRQIEVVAPNGVKMFAKAYVTGNEIYLVVVAPKLGLEGAEKVMTDALDSFVIETRSNS